MSAVLPAAGPAPAAVRLKAALLASALLLVLLAALQRHAARQAASHATAVAPLFFPQKSLGVLLQREAFRHDDLLPVYGASEMISEDAYQAAGMFATQPTGFAVFTVADLGAPTLIQVLRLSAMGPALRGRRVVLSLTPPIHLWSERPATPHDVALGRNRDLSKVPEELRAFARTRRASAYEGTFSRLQALEFALGDAPDAALRRQIARRLLGNPRTLEHAPVLRAALTGLAGEDAWHRALYAAAWPLGVLERAVLRRADAWRVVAWLRTAPVDLRARSAPMQFAWDTLAAQAEAAFRPTTGNNDFGIDSTYWRRYVEFMQTTTVPIADADFRAAVRRPETWRDIDLVLQVLESHGAHVLVVCMPYPGRLADHLGLSRDARRESYAMLDQLAAKHHARIAAFFDHDDDPYFLFDAGSHPSSKAWVLIDQTLDAFYHDALP